MSSLGKNIKKLILKKLSRILHVLNLFLKRMLRSLILLVGEYRKGVFIGLVVIVFCLIGLHVVTSFRQVSTDNAVVSDKTILSKVGKLVTLPEGVPRTIMRVENADALRTQNEFYKTVQAGNYIIAYDTMLIIYDVINNRIVAVKASAKH